MDEQQPRIDAPQNEPEEKKPVRDNFDNRRKLMYVLCGGYLVYLAIKMLRDFPTLTGSERTISLCGGIGFSIIGAGLLVLTAVRTLKQWKREQSEREDTENTEESDNV